MRLLQTRPTTYVAGEKAARTGIPGGRVSIEWSTPETTRSAD